MTKTKRIAHLLYLLTAVFSAGTLTQVFGYEGGTTKNHNHTSAAGDGGTLSNLSVTGTGTFTGIVTAPGFSSTAGGAVVVSTGTPSVPTISFVNDTNTGMYRAVQVSSAIPKGSWSTSTNLVTFASHGYYDVAPFLLTSTGPPTGLTSGTTYFIVWADANHFGLASSAGNAANGVKIALSSQGTALAHTLTPLATHDIGLTNNGVTTGWMAGSVPYGGSTIGATQLFIGGRTQPTQPSELIHAEGTGNTASDYSADIVIYNTTGTASRFVASSGVNNFTGVGSSTPAACGYLIAYGSNTALNGSYWSGGPPADLTANLTLQSGSTSFIQIIQDKGGNNIYFWSQNNNPRFEFCEGSTCGEMASVLLNGIKFGGWSKAQLQAMTTEAGMCDYCNNCTTDNICCSTGTINSFTRVSARTTACN